MPLTYADTYAAQADTAFLQRVAVSLVKTAQAVIAEAANTALHAQRDRLARQVLRDTDTWAKAFAINVALAANIQADANLAAATDAEIDNQVSAVWNSYITF